MQFKFILRTVHFMLTIYNQEFGWKEVFVYTANPLTNV
jgi:hypothetical protein